MTNPSDSVKHMLTVFERPLYGAIIEVQEPYHRHKIDIEPGIEEWRVFQMVQVDKRTVGTVTLSIQTGADRHRIIFHPCKELGYGSHEIGFAAPDVAELPCVPGFLFDALVRLWPTAPEPETKPDPDIVYLRYVEVNKKCLKPIPDQAEALP